VLGGLDAPQRGEVVVGDHDLHALTRNQLADFRRDTVGFVFQHFGLLDTLTALENVALANALTGERPSVGRRKARDLLDAVGLAARADHQPSALSGGERQRVAIARALVNEPQLLLADEPTGNLDDDSTEVIIEVLESLPAEHGCTLVLVTHDRRWAARAERRFRLVEGRLQAGAGDDGPDPVAGGDR
jgi:predicted ABC-type transport system involved in lysophospholipase L1 biosynthesis ATPase subunit